MAINRRAALAFLGLGGGLAASASEGHAAGAWTFNHGVASGDPLADRVILWTRLTPGDPAARPPAVIWTVWADPARKQRVATGQARPEAIHDFTLKIDVAGLKPGRDYWYGFKVDGGAASPVGRTRTLPTGKIKDVVLAVATCSLYPGGYFHAYRAIADLPRVDVILHLGDYIYEYGADGYGGDTGAKLGRVVDPPHEIVTLDDYRRRLAQYRSDPDCQAAHARAPWIAVWDDHETANDSWEHGAENHQPEREGDWDTRKANAIKAYYEWMPIREPRDSLFASYRSFHFGDLAALIMTETRLTARSRQLTYQKDLPMVGGKPDVAGFKAKWNDPARRMMSPAQEAWIGQELTASVKAGHAWQVLGNQVIMARVTAPDIQKTVDKARWDAELAKLPGYAKDRVERLALLNAYGLPYNLDSWDGYPADRERLARAFKAAGANAVVLSGDSHASWANEIFTADGQSRVAAEFGVTAISSPGASASMRDIGLSEAFAAANPEVIFCDQFTRGFLVLTLTRDKAVGQLMGVSSVLEKTFTSAPIKTFAATPAKGGGVEALKEI